LLMLEWGLRRHSLSEVSSSSLLCEALWNRTGSEGAGFIWNYWGISGCVY
jgi:hypothetical protein